MTQAESGVESRESGDEPLHSSPVPRLLTPHSRLLIVGPAALLLLLVGGLFDPPHFFRAWLVGWLLWLGVALGAMGMLMVHHLSGGRWGWPIRRPAEALAGTMPFVALAGLPMLLGLRHLFPWADADRVAHDALLRHRALLFDVPLVVGRAVVFIGLWTALALLLRRCSLRHDATGDARQLARMVRLSAAGLPLYFITMSLASVDWIASREVEWYSSMFGFITILGQAVAGTSVIVLAVASRRDDAGPGYRALLRGRAVHDLGNLLQVVVILWAYVSFFQYLIQWIGNTQDEAMWFHHRTSGGWRWAGLALILLHFGFPFVALLFQRNKRDLRNLAFVAAGVLLMRCVDMLWTIVPSAEGVEPHGLHWLDLVAIVAAAWGCGSLFVWQLGRAALVPLAAIDATAIYRDAPPTHDAQPANL